MIKLCNFHTKGWCFSTLKAQIQTSSFLLLHYNVTLSMMGIPQQVGLDSVCLTMPERSPARERAHTTSGKGQHQCTYCSYSTSIRTNFSNHMRIHTGEKPFTCQVCPYRSNQKTNLKTHMRTHSGEKPHMCSKCPFSCSSRITLVTHMWSRHQTLSWNKLINDLQ